jgi:hypothetical protein
LPKAKTEFTVAIEKENNAGNIENKTLQTGSGEQVLCEVISVENVINDEPEKKIIINDNLDEHMAEKQTELPLKGQEKSNEYISPKNGKKEKNEPLLFDFGDNEEQNEEANSNSKNKKSRYSINFNFETLTWEGISEQKTSLWEKAYPACDIELELIAMAAWLSANPEHKKVNYERFIVNWLSKSQQRGGNRIRNGVNGNFKTFTQIKNENTKTAVAEVIEEIQKGDFL